MNASVSSAQNWSALLDLKFRAAQDKTRLVPVRRYGPLSVQRPFYPEADVCHTYLLHPPGGVVGGDQLDLNIQCEPHSSSLVTTPGATKFYKSAQKTAVLKQMLTVGESASLEFLPQENIYFPGALLQAHTRLDVVEGSSALLWEKHCFGRPASDESFDSGQVKTRLDVYQQDQLIFSETQRVDYAEISRSSGLRNNPVMGTFIIFSKNMNESMIEACRELETISGIAGITQPTGTLLLVRYMGNSTLELNAYFVKLWEILRSPLLDRNACHPRIWNT